MEVVGISISSWSFYVLACARLCLLSHPSKESSPCFIQSDKVEVLDSQLIRDSYVQFLNNSSD